MIHQPILRSRLTISIAARAESAPLFPALSPEAIQGLLDGLRRQDPEDHRHARRQARLQARRPPPARRRGRNAPSRPGSRTPG